MFFGLQNLPATFQNMMNNTLDKDDGNLEPLKMEGYIDDMLPHGQTQEECRHHTIQTQETQQTWTITKPGQMHFHSQRSQLSGTHCMTQ